MINVFSMPTPEQAFTVGEKVRASIEIRTMIFGNILIPRNSIWTIAEVVYQFNDFYYHIIYDDGTMWLVPSCDLEPIYD